MAWIKNSLFLRLALLILIGTGLIQFAVITANQHSMKQVMLQDQENYYTTLAASSAHEINHDFFAAEKAVDQVVALFKTVPATRQNMQALLKDMLQQNPALFGGAIALAPNQDTDAAGFQILYSWRDDGQIQTIDRANPTSDYQSDWFYLPYYLEKPIWSDPYYDADTQTKMVTYSAPVIADGNVTAVITCDLTLEQIQTLLSSLKLGRRGIPILLSQYGRMIIHPNEKWVQQETLCSLAESATTPEDRDTMLTFSQKVLHEGANSLRFQRLEQNEMNWIYCGTVATTGWRVGFIIPEKEILAPIQALNKKIARVALIGMLLLLIPAFWVARRVTRPLQELGTAADKLAGGQFDAPLPKVKSRDEIGRLIGDFDRMRIDLKNYIDNLAATTAEKEKISSELSIARDIQHSILPKLFPPFPTRSGLDLYALLESAKEVGGDLYDFALLDDDHLYLCIGDVSGKGVPASLFMAVGKTLLKSTIQTIQDPARALFHVNNELAEGNDTCMFITTFCAILDLTTNRLTYSNAGHNPPIVINNGLPTFLGFASAPPLAALSDSEYKNETVDLLPGSKFLLYTDGVTEAMNPQNELFGEDRLIAHLEKQKSQTAEKCIHQIARTVRNFVGTAEQSDDITMLCMSYNAQQPIASDRNSPTTALILTNHREEFAKLPTWLEQIATKLSWSQELMMQLNLVLEEWIVNVVSYAFEDELVHEIELRLWQTAEKTIIEITDDGIPFDPTDQAAPDLTIPVEERAIGGLGIHFIRNTMDEFTYQRQDGENVITMIKNL